jgi:hypothetical protein
MVWKWWLARGRVLKKFMVGVKAYIFDTTTCWQETSLPDQIYVWTTWLWEAVDVTGIWRSQYKPHRSK